MGKIFDALEKANNQIARTIPASRPEAERRRKSEDADNIVTFGNPDKIIFEPKLDSTLIAYHAPASVEAELFKVLKTNLLFPPEGNPPRKILVTSPLPGDGKSFVAANLAISIAHSVEEYVLLIDCDIRKPTIHRSFGLGQTAGLSEYLSMGTDLAKILLKSPIPKLTILPAGKAPRNPTELLTSKRMKELMVEVVSRYDDRYILIDSPPPSMAAETNALINIVDGVICVVKAGKTPMRAVAETIELIGKDKMLGIVLNSADQKAKKYYGYNKSYYSSGQTDH
jgi:protein-tyrosine kinase